MHIYHQLLCLGTLALIALSAGMVSSCTLPPPDLSTPEAVERVYTRKCGYCHAAIAPGDFHPDDWPGIFDEYAPRANLRPDERPAVEGWVIERAIKAYDQRQAAKQAQ